MGSYDRIRAAIEGIRFADGHSHVLHWNIAPPSPSGPHEVLPLSWMLLGFNTRLIYVSAGMPTDTARLILDGRIDAAGQREALLAHPAVAGTMPCAVLMRGLRELYGLKAHKIGPENFDECNALLRGRGGFYPLWERVCENAGVGVSVLNLWARLCPEYVGGYRDGLSAADRALDQKRFLFAATLDYQALKPFSPMALELSGRFGLPHESIDDYEQLLERAARHYVREKGARAFKISEMYYRRLDYAPTSRAQAAQYWGKTPTPEGEKVISDFAACTTLRLAGEYGIPVQIHTGALWGEYAGQNVNPGYLSEIIKAFPGTTFDLLHGGDPYFADSALLAQVYPNVYLNMSSMPMHSYINFARWLDFYLDTVPYSKLSLGWDVFLPELVCGAAYFTRDAVARVLAGKIDAGLYDFDIALDVAARLMHGTVESVYGGAAC